MTVYIPKQGQTPKQFGTQLFKHRLARLNRLVELNAPATIVANEIRLVTSAAWLMMPTEMGTSAAEDLYIKGKRGFGFCTASVECNKQVDRKSNDSLCAEHEKEFEEYGKGTKSSDDNGPLGEV
jgi:hypothetical protein